MKRKLIASLLMLGVSLTGYAQQVKVTQSTQTGTFKFASGDNMFYGVEQGNDAELKLVVMLRIPAKAEEPKPEPIVDQPEPQAVVEEVMVAPEAVPSMHVPQPRGSYFALRTNLLYDAFLVPNLGLEWRLNESWGIKVDAGGSYWGSETGNVQKLWYVNPEVRFYMGKSKRFYAGISGNYAAYNIYKGMIGNVFSKDTGYQGTMWNAGAVVGYQLPLGRAFALDFNLGLGYNSCSYDSFSLINQTRVYKEKDVTKNSFGVTQAGISLVWKFSK